MKLGAVLTALRAAASERIENDEFGGAADAVRRLGFLSDEQAGTDSATFRCQNRLLRVDRRLFGEIPVRCG